MKNTKLNHLKFEITSGCLFRPLISGLRFQSRFYDRDVAGAAAQIAGDHVAYPLLIRVGLVSQKSVQRRQHSWRTEAALQGMMFTKSRLQRGQCFRIRQALDGHDPCSLRLYGEHQARADGGIVDDNGTSATDAMFTTDMRACQTHLVAEAIGERSTWHGFDYDGGAVDFELDCHGASRCLGRSLYQGAFD
jgi:hypothetical protein